MEQVTETSEPSGSAVCIPRSSPRMRSASSPDAIAIRVAADHEEFLPTPARDDVGVAKRRRQLPRHLPQHAIAGRVPVHLIDAPEVVDVDDEEDQVAVEGRAHPARPHDGGARSPIPRRASPAVRNDGCCTPVSGSIVRNSSPSSPCDWRCRCTIQPAKHEEQYKRHNRVAFPLGELGLERLLGLGVAHRLEGAFALRAREAQFERRIGGSLHRARRHVLGGESG